MSLSIGQAVPDFTVLATNNRSITLSALHGHNVVLYFYPKDNTPGCTTEGQNFRDLYADFVASNTLVFGISRDSLKVHAGFRCKHALPFELISDADEQLCELFGVMQYKKLYGKEYLGIERSTFLLDSQGVLQEAWRSVKVPGHAAVVLAAAQALRNQ